MDVGWSDLGSWTALLAALAGGDGRGARAASSSRARRSRSAPDDLVVRPVDGRLAVEAAAGGAAVRSSPTASGRTSPGPATSTAEVRGAARPGRPARRSARDDHRRGPGPDDDRLRHRRLAGARSPTTSRSRTSAAAPTASPATSSGAASRRRASSSPSTGGSPRSTSRPPPPRSSSPTTSRSPTRPHAVPTQMSSYEVVERGAAAGHRDHRQPQPVDRQRLQGQGADRRRGRRRRSSPVLEAAIAANGGTAIERRPFADAEAAGLVERFDPYEGYERVPPPDDRPRRAEGGRRRRSSSSRCTAPAPAGSRACSPAAGSGSPRSTSERNPFFGGINPEPIRPNVDEALGDHRGRRLRPRACCSTATRTGRARPTSRARSSTSSRSPAC